jgi:hypothetical protein
MKMNNCRMKTGELIIVGTGQKITKKHYKDSINDSHCKKSCFIHFGKKYCTFKCLASDTLIINNSRLSLINEKCTEIRNKTCLRDQYISIKTDLNEIALGGLYCLRYLMIPFINNSKYGHLFSDKTLSF